MVGMAQPTPYDKSANFAEDETNAVGGRSTVRTAALDAELDGVQVTLSQTLANLELIQRDDGALRDSTVRLHTLSPEVAALLAASGNGAIGPWVTATSYAIRDLVSFEGGSYLCGAAHTSGSFSADLNSGFWLPISSSEVQTVEFGSETKVSTAGQSIFDLEDGSYTLGTNSLRVFVDGFRLTRGVDYVETNSTRFTLLFALPSGRRVTYEYGRAVSTGLLSSQVSHTTTGGEVYALDDYLNEQPANVKWYGATGDGTTNDTAAINAAIAALNAGTVKRLYFPHGTYRVAGALTTITRAGATLLGDGKRQSVIYQTSSTDTLRFASTSPATTALGDITITGIGFDQQGASAPTAGVALTLTRVIRGYFDIDIRNVFAGLLMEGCGELHFVSTTITGAYSWSALATGSYLMRLAYHTASSTNNSEIYFNGFNLKGAGSFGAALYLSSGVIVEAVDGLFMANGHVGFSHNASLFINAQAVAGASIQNVEWTQVYFDGNGAGNTSTSLILVAGSTTPVAEHFKFDGCQFKNFDGNAFDCSLSTLRDLRVVNCEFSACGGSGLILTDQSEFTLASNLFKDLNGNASGTSAAIALTGSTKGVITGNQLLAATSAHSSGLSVNATCADLAITSNSFEGHTADMTVASGAARITFGRNRKIGSEPTVVAASTITLPVGYDEVEVTGNTGITTINTPIERHRVTLVFAGTPTVTDGSNLNLAGNFTATAGSTLTLMGYGGNWSEVARAAV